MFDPDRLAVLVRRLRLTRSRLAGLYSLSGAVLIGALILYIVGPYSDRYPATVAGLLSFVVGPRLFPRSLPNHEHLSPLGFAFVVFFIQLVVLPLLLVYGAPDRGVLPFLPTATAINVAILLSCIAFLAFVLSCHYATIGTLFKAHRTSPTSACRAPSRRLVGVYLALGVFGLVLAFHTPAALLAYYRKAGHAVDLLPQSGQRGLLWNLGIILRPFLAFGVVMTWCRWLEARRRHRARVTLLVSVGAVLLVLLASSTFQYNRASFVAPIVAMLAVYGARVRRTRPMSLAVIALCGFLALTAYQAVRSSRVSFDQALTSHRAEILRHTHLVAELETYGAAPQYVGYLLQQTAYGRHLYFGRTLVASILAPLPILGKPYRALAGGSIYNQLIYGDLGFPDQVLPFQGELFMNGSFVAVALGYLLLGRLFQRCEYRWWRSRTATELYCWQYTAVWLAYLLVGGLASVSQQLFYSFWPLYVFALWQRQDLVRGWATWVKKV